LKHITILTVLTTFLFSSMIGEPHDLTSGIAISESEVCIHCHQSNSTIPPYDQGEAVSEEFISSTLSCISCHDGVSASNQHSYTTNIDSNLIDPEAGHPVYITYIDGTYNLKPKNTIIYRWDNADKIDDLLVDGKLKCISCHNPHHNRYQTYLRTTNERSDLCKSCH